MKKDREKLLINSIINNDRLIGIILEIDNDSSIYCILNNQSHFESFHLEVCDIKYVKNLIETLTDVNVKIEYVQLHNT